MAKWPENGEGDGEWRMEKKGIGRTTLTFGEAQLLGNGAGNFGGGGVTVEIDFIHAVPVHVGATQLQTVDGCIGRAETGTKCTHTQNWKLMGRAAVGMGYKMIRGNNIMSKCTIK